MADNTVFGPSQPVADNLTPAEVQQLLQAINTPQAVLDGVVKGVITDFAEFRAKVAIASKSLVDVLDDVEQAHKKPGDSPEFWQGFDFARAALKRLEADRG